MYIYLFLYLLLVLPNDHVQTRRKVVLRGVHLS